MNQLKSILERIPMTMVLLLFIAYLGYDYLDFLGNAPFFSNPDSPYLQKRSQIEREKADILKMEEKIKQAAEFNKTLDAKRAQIRDLALELENMKATLPDHLNVPELMKEIYTEAQKVGLKVEGLKPMESSNKEFYEEQGFNLAFKGVYVQIMIFMDRLSNLNKIVRIENFAMTPMGTNTGRYVELKGELQLKAYRYQHSKADDVGKPDLATPAPAGAAKKAEKGGA